MNITAATLSSIIFVAWEAIFSKISYRKHDTGVNIFKLYIKIQRTNIFCDDCNVIQKNVWSEKVVNVSDELVSGKYSNNTSFIR